ncbi:RHS repeat-associated core domain-containing protein [Pirellulaceae bacterium SH501]
MLETAQELRSARPRTGEPNETLGCTEATTPDWQCFHVHSINASVGPSPDETTTVTWCYQRNQQFSITAMTTSTGAVAERYAYTAYGEPTFLDASGSPLTPQTSTLNARYMYTGREWDSTVGLYHFRARWMSPKTGRFLTRDPIGYAGGKNLYRQGMHIRRVDPLGTDDDDPGDNPFGFPRIRLPIPLTKEDIQKIIDEWIKKINDMAEDEAKAQCQLWLDFDTKLGDDWLKKLPTCPCTKAGAEGSKKPKWVEFPTDVNSHKGYSTCFRSAPSLLPPNPAQGGQQCCYDDKGNLITSGTGAGTPDRRNPSLNPLGHFIHDVYPWLVCSKGGMLDKYLERRPNDQGEDENGKPCEENPTNPPKEQSPVK